MIEIQLGGGYVALIDDEDAVKVCEYRWRRSKLGYATCKHGGKLLLMHRVILGAAKGEIVDHANHNTLDNTKKNIRLCSHAENMRNSKTHKNNQLGLKGVYPERGKYRARISLSGKRFNIGYFDTPELAFDAYKQAAIEMHGKFACVN